MKIISNKNNPFNLRVETVISKRVYEIYLDRIHEIKGWVKNCSNLARAKILLDAMLILEQQQQKCILHDFDYLWSMLYYSQKNN